MRTFALVSVGLLLATVLLVVEAPRTSAITYTNLPSTFQVAPGSVSGSISDLFADDTQQATVTEQDTTAALDQLAWLVPISDASILWAQVGGIPCIPAGHYCYLLEPPHDGNTSIVASGASSVEDIYDAEDWGARPTDITIDGAQAFAWARKNQSAEPAFGLRLFDTNIGNACIQTVPTTTQAFANYSGPLEPVTCLGAAWTVAGVDNVLVAVAKINIGPLATVTSAGVIVQYDDRDYNVAAYVNFSGVKGDNLELVYDVGTPSLGGSETIAIQSRRSGTWTTIASAVSGRGSVILQSGGQDVVDGDGQFRIVDSDATDDTQGSFAFDEFWIQGEEVTLPPPGGNGGVLVIRCTPGIWSLSCFATLNDSVPASIHIAGTDWYFDGVLQGRGSPFAGSSRQHHFEGGGFAVGHTWIVTVEAHLDNTQRIRATIEVRQDNAPLVVILILAIVAIVALVLLRKHRGPARPEGKNNPRTEIVNPRRGAGVLLLVLVGAIALVSAPSAAAEEPPSESYLRIELETPIAYTNELITIRVVSWLLDNTTGNGTWIPNPHQVLLELVDESQDVVVGRWTISLLNGTGDRLVLVEESWTSSRMRVSAQDPSLGLVASETFKTEMSDRYLLFRMRSDIWDLFVTFAANERAEKDASITQDRLLTGGTISAGILVVTVLAVRRDHRVSRRVGTVSVWDRFSRRAFPWTLPTDEMDVWLDRENTWDPQGASEFEEFRREAHVAKLEAQKAEIDKEIAGVREGAIA